MEKEKLNEVNSESIRCNDALKPPKPPGMSINAYCPCNNGVWGEWIDPQIAE